MKADLQTLLDELGCTGHTDRMVFVLNDGGVYQTHDAPAVGVLKWTDGFRGFDDGLDDEYLIKSPQ